MLSRRFLCHGWSSVAWIFSVSWAALTVASKEFEEHHKYCIVGAGPAGVQLGNFLLTAPGGPRDYVILERSERAAAFFSKYPVHRVLNSINRRHTRHGNLEFNLRHDWNSLLGAEKTVGLFTNWTEDYWPSADLMVEYINAFAAPQVEKGHLRFCTNVKRVEKCKKERKDKCTYELLLQNVCKTSKVCESDSCAMDEKSTEDEGPLLEESKMTCSVLVMANGMWKPREVQDWIVDLNRHSVLYDQLSGVNPKDFLNKSVLILGEGNAAAETADAVRNYARDIVMVSRKGTKQLRDTRYVGDLRARRTTYIDANSFKSYEGQTAMSFLRWVVMVRCGPDEVNTGFNGSLPVCLFTMMEDDVVTLAPISRSHQALIDEAVRLFGDKVFRRPASKELMDHARAAGQMFSSWRYAPKEVLCTKLVTLQGNLTDEQMRILPKLRRTTKYIVAMGMEFEKPFDVAIAALGWRYDRSALTSLKLAMSGPPWRTSDTEVYPDLTGEFESTNSKHLFVAGAASHGRDRYRYKASGGFIHGFRFNCRTLWRILESRYEEKRKRSIPPLATDGTHAFDWNPLHRHQEESSSSEWMDDFGENLTSLQAASPLWGHLIERINTAGGPYEMVAGSLSDAIIYDCKKKTAWYLEDVTEDLIHDRYSSYPRMTWSYYYGSNIMFREKAVLCNIRSARTRVLGSFVHPVLQYFPPGVRPYPYKAKPPMEQMGIAMTHRTLEHPSIFFEHLEGVSRVHIPDQFVWSDWTDIESLGILAIFMRAIENAGGRYCTKQGDGHVEQAFDEEDDVKMFIGPEWQDGLTKVATENGCWGDNG